MEVKDRDEYEKYVNINSGDGYSKGVVDYEKRWCDLMEKKMADGAELKDIWKDCSFEVAEGITGFMYGCAVASLSRHWVHGEELRKLHNLDTQIGSEGEDANQSGGVLNPALLTIGK